MKPKATEKPSTLVGQSLAFLLFCCIYLQKFGVSIGANEISVPFILTFLAVIYLGYRGALRFSKLRLLAFASFVSLVFLSQLFVDVGSSAMSIMFLIATYFLFTISFAVEEDEHSRVMAAHCRYMIIPAAMVFVQYAYELMAGPGNSLGMNRMVPSSILLNGYMYESSTATWRVWNRPNGFFFLEPSFASLFIASACWIEFSFFHRVRRGLFFLAALFLTAGATGLLCFAIALFWAARKSQPFIFSALAAAGVLLTVLTGGIDLSMIPRLGELSNTQSSGYGRLVAPFQSIFQIFTDPTYLLTGRGAGHITANFGSPWPIVKLGYEYGALATISWLVLFTAAVFGRTLGAFRVAIYIVFQFTGGYLLSPVMCVFVFLLFSSYRVSIQPGLKVEASRTDGASVRSTFVTHKA